MLLTAQNIVLPKSSPRGLMETLQSKYASDLNVTLGCDFLAALEAGSGSTIHLIDRRVSTTMARISSSMSRFQRLKFSTDLVWQIFKSVFESKRKIKKYLEEIMSGDNDMLTLEMNKLKKRHKNIYNVVVGERDIWLR